MKALKFLIHIIGITAICILSYNYSYPQSVKVTADGDNSSQIKLSIGYANLRSDEARISFPNGVTIPVPILESHAFIANAGYKIVGNHRYNVYGVGEFSTNINRSRFHQYGFGTHVGVKLFKLEPYGKLLLGLYRTEDAKNRFVKTLGVGVDVNATKHFFFTPIEYSRQFTDNFSLNTHRIAVRVGIKF